ncbi:hypothetical protein ACFZCL_04010 [Streptomyces sp. NPDC008159]|uniref:hypothetical protein n=1 Tax=Streptomyces sp. NPDC008159 TaxID=3364817 RepID=UPI0036EEB7DC
MSASTVPTVWALSRPVRDGVRCLRCSLPLDGERVPAGVARGYWGAHDLSVTVYVHLECPPASTG